MTEIDAPPTEIKAINAAWNKRLLVAAQTSRSRFALMATAFAGATSAAFGGFFGGRALQMRDDLGDGMDWFGAFSFLVDAALGMSALAAVLACAFICLVCSQPGSSP